MIKLVVDEQGSSGMLALCAASPPDAFAVSALAFVEVRSGLRRRERAGDLASQAVADAINLLMQTISVVRVERVTRKLCGFAAELIDRQPLRSLDVIQLASALSAQAATGRPVQFTSADQRLLKMAADEGLSVWDPNQAGTTQKATVHAALP